MAKIGKRLKGAQTSFDREKAYGLADAIKLVKSNAKAKFDETVEIAMNLGIDPRHADQMVRGVVQLPNGTGKTVRVAVFARAAKAEEALAAGADVVGADDLAGEQGLVADQRRKGRNSGHGEGLQAGACGESAADPGCQAGNVERAEKLRKRQIFAKRDEVRLVVDGGDGAGAVDHEQRVEIVRAVLQPHDAGKSHDAPKSIVFGNASANGRQLAPGLAIVLADDARHVAFVTACDGRWVLLVGQGACGKDPQSLFALRISDSVDARAVLEVHVVRRQRVVHARPRQSAIFAASHRSRVSAVAEVPDAKHRLVVREHRRRRMRVILVRLW